MDLKAWVQLEKLSRHDGRPLTGVDIPVEVDHHGLEAGDLLDPLLLRHGGGWRASVGGRTADVVVRLLFLFAGARVRTFLNLSSHFKTRSFS